MRIQRIVSIIVIATAIILVGWGLFQTGGSDAEIQSKLDEVTPAGERGDINAVILKQKTVTDALSKRVFGILPSDSDPNVGRDNPFEGI